jgi:hypothetical protein
LSGDNIVTVTPEGGVRWKPNNPFASVPCPVCQDLESSEIAKIFYGIMTKGGTGGTDNGMNYYILFNSEHSLRFTGAK